MGRSSNGNHRAMIANNRIHLTVKSVMFFAKQKNTPLFTSSDAGVRKVMNSKSNSHKITVILFCLLFNGCTSGLSSKVMNEEIFWKIIESSMYECGEEKYQDECLEIILLRHTPDQILEFYRIFNQYHQKADKGYIWAAGMLLNSGHGTDDGFIYFRNWLISSGKEVYFNALKNPDSLAEANVYKDVDGHPDAEFEEFSYIPVEIYEKKTNGRNLYEDLDEKSLKYDSDWNWSDYDNEKWLTKNLPHLYKKYGHLKKQSDQEIESYSIKTITEVDVPNIGVIKINEPIYHKNYGKGVIREIFPFNEIMTTNIEFSDGIHPMILNPESNIESLFSLTPFN